MDDAVMSRIGNDIDIKRVPAGMRGCAALSSTAI
jgi:hypothetical protein